MAKRVRLLQQVDAIRDNREILDSAVHFLSELAAEEWRVVEGELSNVDSYGNEDVPSALYLLMLE